MQTVMIGGIAGAAIGAVVGLYQLNKSKKQKANDFVTQVPKRHARIPYLGTYEQLGEALEDILPPRGYEHQGSRTDIRRIIYAQPVSFWVLKPYYVFILDNNELLIGVVNRNKERGMTSKKQLQVMVDLVKAELPAPGLSI